VDAYQGTRTESAIGDVLKRGGAIGGSSAGATIQGHYLVRGNPLGNQVMMAEGYERGFGFLPGAAIDQHFSQRRREADMEHLMRTFPQLLGVGIDESTAIVVQSTTARVIGANAVYFYDQRLDEDSSGPQVQKLTAGQVYDLSRRAKVD
jgi:cyanophycinase